MRPLRIQRGMPGIGRKVAVAAALIAALAGCARWKRTTESRLTSRTASPSVRASEQGLELWTWIVSDPRRQLPATPGVPGDRAYLIRDDKTDIESLLLSHAGRPVPMSDDVRQRWRGAGLRIVAVPVADLDRIVSASRLVGQVQRQWMGEVPEWSDLVRGLNITSPTRVALADGVIALDPGRLRLVLRSWIVPDAREQGPAGAALHMEIAPRLDQIIPERERLIAAAQGRTIPPAVVFSTLAATMTVRSNDALVVLADAPGADWASPPAPAEDDGPHGPPSPRTTSLGELLLTTAPTPQQPRTRMVMAIVPRVPARFELLR